MYSRRQANVGRNARLVLGANQTPWMQLGRPTEHYLRKRRFFAFNLIGADELAVGQQDPPPAHYQRSHGLFRHPSCKLSRFPECVVAAHSEQVLICFILACEVPMPETSTKKDSLALF